MTVTTEKHGNSYEDPGDFYKQLREKICKWLATEEGKRNRWAQYVLIAPDLLHLLCRLAFDARVPAKSKAKLAGAIAYFISPFDLIPEAIVGPVGYVDDVALAAHVLDEIVNESGEDVVRGHWAGEEDILALIKQVLKVADEMVGSGLWKKMRRQFGWDEEQ